MIKDELTYKIIGCAMKVHNTLGNGFQEVIYQRCLAIELKKSRLQFVREKDLFSVMVSKWVHVELILSLKIKWL